MSVKSDEWIIEMSKSCGMIKPFDESLVSKGVISFGVSSYGYDVRLSDEYRIPRKIKGETVDPKDKNSIVFEDFKGKECIIPPNSFVLGRSYEYFRIPREIIAICFGKSTYARSGVMVNVTPLEPEWEGYITISISNTSPFPVKIHSFEGICQVLFVEAERMCSISYADRRGKYQTQHGIVPSKV
ncbi:MAG: dCTP deaminase [Candidatus Neomarinimicrobiota bacterium]|nr:MAG: dCTP deaminase [Candidatus Neomarinimicrobiota bacterium]